MPGLESSREKTESLEAMAARVRASFARQAMMATLGVQLAVVQRGRVELIVDHDDRFTQQHGFLHARAVTAVLDRQAQCPDPAQRPRMLPDEAKLIALLAGNLPPRFAMNGTVILRRCRPR